MPLQRLPASAAVTASASSALASWSRALVAAAAAEPQRPATSPGFVSVAASRRRCSASTAPTISAARLGREAGGEGCGVNFGDPHLIGDQTERMPYRRFLAERQGVDPQIALERIEGFQRRPVLPWRNPECRQTRQTGDQLQRVVTVEETARIGFVDDPEKPGSRELVRAMPQAPPDRSASLKTSRLSAAGGVRRNRPPAMPPSRRRRSINAGCRVFRIVRQPCPALPDCPAIARSDPGIPAACRSAAHRSTARPSRTAASMSSAAWSIRVSGWMPKTPDEPFRVWNSPEDCRDQRAVIRCPLKRYQVAGRLADQVAAFQQELFKQRVHAGTPVSTATWSARSGAATGLTR